MHDSKVSGMPCAVRDLLASRCTSCHSSPPDAERADVPHDLRPRRDAGTGSDAGNPYNTPTTCTSGTYWMGGDTKSPDMHPGVPCRKCHVLLGSASGKEFDIAGTVYPTAHEPDDCNGLAGVTVVITDANNVDHPFNVTNAGNFYHEDAFGFAKIAVPYKAKVVRNGMTRAMSAAQTDGNCNNCHTETGAQNAPGSIMAP